MIVPVTADTSAFLPKFLEFYMMDLKRQFPKFQMDRFEHDRHVFITRDMVPVGLFSYQYQGEDEVHINLDYVIPSYRDYKTARYLFNEFGRMLAPRGFKRYVTLCHSKIYRRYLLRMGFQQDTDNPERYTKEIL